MAKNNGGNGTTKTVVIIISLVLTVMAVALSFGKYQAAAIGDVVELHRSDMYNTNERVREIEQTVPVMIERLEGIQRTVNRIDRKVNKIPHE